MGVPNPRPSPLAENREQSWGRAGSRKKKGGVGWEGKKNSIFVKREKDLVENFYWEFFKLKKKQKKKKTQKKKKETILASYVYQLLGQGCREQG